MDGHFGEDLEKTATRFNESARKGVDYDLQRGEHVYDRERSAFPPTAPGVQWHPEGSKNYTMHPLCSKGPYHVMMLGAGTLDTNGGPMIDHKAQVIYTENKPIPGPYGAGDRIASPTANAY
ncbi:MAG: FAD-binding protein [Euryarchaeota archaeon]|nr:FAD-binding protein [Euryarchaeota archaeon]